jgi:hypothetical protein
MPPIPPDQVSPYGPTSASARRLVPTRGVAERYGVHLRSVARWVARGVIPPPDQTINGRHYWWEETLEQADRRRTIEAAAAKSQPGKPASVINHDQEPQSAP